MQLLNSVRPALATCLLVSFAGCGVSQSNPGGPGALPQVSLKAPHRDRGHSWMARNAEGMELLYVSDLGTGDVDVYSYPHGKQVGALTGFNGNQGECTDNAGNVYITTSSTIYEYAHGGTLPIKTLANPGYVAMGCSVDPLTGNLAVTNFCSEGGPSGCQGQGSLAIYAGATGTPTQYRDSKVFFYKYCGYDDGGNLYLDGYSYASSHETPEFAELKFGKSAFTDITLQQTLMDPGGVQWDGQYVALGDQTQSVIYQTRGTKGKIFSSTALVDSSNVAQFWIDRKFVVAPDNGFASVYFYKYPAGGYPVKTISGFDQPVGAVVSLKR